MIALINQPCGLGDILFTLKIGHYFGEQGYRVIWPVVNTYKCLQEKIDSKHVNFFPLDGSFPYKNQFIELSNTNLTECTFVNNEILYVPLTKGFYSASAKKINGYEKSNMLSKYKMCNLEFNNWQHYFTIKRNKKKEEELFAKYNITKEYHFVNNRFGTPPTWEVFLNKFINTPNNLQRIEAAIFPQYDVFDLSKIIENADKIDTVATSLPFIFEKLELKCTPTIHSRNQNKHISVENFDLMNILYNKYYNYET